jgi:hypothetical protein
MHLLDALVMWIFEYPEDTAVQELQTIDHNIYEAWVGKFQKACSRSMEGKIIFPGMTTAMVNPRRPVLKKPSASNHCTHKKILKKPAGKVKELILQMDESFLNRGKRSKLSKAARPKRDQIWIWGCVVQGRPDLFAFRILDHPADAFDNRPRGKKEMLYNLQSTGVKAGWTIASDCWGGTLAAVKTYRAELGLTEAQLKHETVNHSAGEIVNARGYTTNLIENRWSVLKRWLKKRCAGKLPRTNDRRRWRLYVGEFQFRKYHDAGTGERTSRLPHGHPLRAAMFHHICAALAADRHH